MARGLYAICEKCGRSIESVDVHRISASRIASLVRDAERGGWELRLSGDSVPSGCECNHIDETVRAASVPGKLPGKRRLTIRQLLFITTVVAVLLAIFRHPIRLLFDPRVWQATVAPWSVYAWLFWRGDFVRPPDLKSAPMAAIAFAVSTPLAVLTAFFGGWGLLRLIGRCWRQVSHE